MAITSLIIKESAQTVAASRNGANVIISIDTPVASGESLVYFALITISSPSVLTWIDFNISTPSEYNMRFYAKDVIDAESFYTSNANPTVSANLDRLAQIILQNPVLSQYYDVVRTSPSVLKVSSKRPGSMYDLSNVITTSESGINVTFDSFDSGTVIKQGATVADNYFVLDVYVANNLPNDIVTTPNANNFRSITKVKLPVNNQTTNFEISDLLADQINSDNRPDAIWPNNIIRITSNDSIHFKTNIAISYPDPLTGINVENTYAFGNSHKAYFASLPKEDYNDYSAYTTSTPVKLRTTRKSPDVRRSTYNVLEFYTTQAASSLEARFMVVFEDGTTSATIGWYGTYHIATSIAAPFKGNYAYCFFISEVVKDIEALNNKKAKEIYIVICSNKSASAYTDQVHYIIDNDESEFEFNVIYQNRLNGYDSTTFTGEIEYVADIDRLTAYKSNNYAFKAGDKNDFTYRTDYRQIRRVTGEKLDRDQIQDALEMCRSNNVFAIVPLTTPNITYVYDYTSCNMLQGPSGTAWSNDAGTSGACFRKVTLSAASNSANLYLQPGYFPSGTQAFQAVNHSLTKIGRLRSLSGTGLLTVEFLNNSSIVKSESFNINTDYQNFYSNYNESIKADVIRFRISNNSPSTVNYEFYPGEGIQIVPLQVQFQYLMIETQSVNYSSKDDLQDVVITFKNTNDDTNL